MGQTGESWHGVFGCSGPGMSLSKAAGHPGSKCSQLLNTSWARRQEGWGRQALGPVAQGLRTPASMLPQLSGPREKTTASCWKEGHKHQEPKSTGIGERL